MEDIEKILENAARFAAAKGLRKYTRFLDPAQAAFAERMAREYRVRFSAFGGYADAERVVGCFHPWDDEVDVFPVCCLSSAYSSRFASISHRDLLGAFMALGLTRACIGDMIIAKQQVFIFAVEETASFIAQSMTSAGKVSLDFQILDEIPPMPDPVGSEFTAVISSLRLDAVLAAAYHLSRSAAADQIRAGQVKLNHLPCDRVDTQLEEGALLSLRGKGRVRLQTVGGMTKKQRICVTFFRYE